MVLFGSAAFVLFLFVLFVLWAWPQYRVYNQRMRGEAAFREAEINRQIIVETAKAEELALKARAVGEAERERIRAGATADAIDLIANQLEDNPAYLRYLWITGLHDDKGERIYIPTEAGLPILEARPRLGPVSGVQPPVDEARLRAEIRAEILDELDKGRAQALAERVR